MYVDTEAHPGQGNGSAARRAIGHGPTVAPDPHPIFDRGRPPPRRAWVARTRDLHPPPVGLDTAVAVAVAVATVVTVAAAAAGRTDRCCRPFTVEA
jgi:hypothetical protein